MTTIADLLHDDAAKPPAKRIPKSDSARNKRYYEENREKRLVYMREYYQNNIDRCRATARVRQAKWREELRAYKRSLFEAGGNTGEETPSSLAE
jgi:hypothetical protein